MLIGSWGTGKSTAWATVNDWIRRTGSDRKLYVVDTDRAAARVAPDLPDDQVREVFDFPQYVEAVEHFSSVGTADDFLVVDLVSKAWDEVQSHYINEAFGKRASDFFLEAKKSGADGSPLAGSYGSNWQVINKMYGDFITPVFRWPGHVIACSPSESVAQPDRQGKGGDSAQILDTFGRFGVKPGGQKMLGFQFMTVLNMSCRRQGDYRYTTIKDVRREVQTDKAVGDFVMDYLVEVAGWTL